MVPGIIEEEAVRCQVSGLSETKGVSHEGQEGFTKGGCRRFAE
jgi:hypothetical protein